MITSMVCKLCYRLTTTLLVVTYLIAIQRQSTSHAASRKNQNVQRSNCRQPSSDVLWMRLNSLSQGAAPHGFASRPTNMPNTDEIWNDNEQIDTFASEPVADRQALGTSKSVRDIRRRRRHLNRNANSTLAVEKNELQSANSDNVELHANLTNDVIDDVTTPRVKNRRVKSDMSNDMKRLSARTSWHCGVEKYWKRMSPDVYPPYIQTGRCTVSTCMLGLYECRPIKYVINVLRRNAGRHRCVPLPTTNTSDTTFEQAWTMSNVHVVVACQCSNKRTNPNSRQSTLTP